MTWRSRSRGSPEAGEDGSGRRGTRGLERRGQPAGHLQAPAGGLGSGPTMARHYLPSSVWRSAPLLLVLLAPQSPRAQSPNVPGETRLREQLASACNAAQVNAAL